MSASDNGSRYFARTPFQGQALDLVAKAGVLPANYLTRIGRGSTATLRNPGIQF